MEAELVVLDGEIGRGKIEGLGDEVVISIHQVLKTAEKPDLCGGQYKSTAGVRIITGELLIVLRGSRLAS
ncbi:hypothetical protein GCM10011495_37050 [Hymenobacter frigidus]|uniref:Uncharacterized protein n=1 Tax=Hymenobacter frigidus TaxID=1524095 RepID=A0ABQ2AIB5_9BACT|nr:hypothetical protein GCM10011495_37050 [Hymenobacter frigidus]